MADAKIQQAASEISNMVRVFRAFENAENAVTLLQNYDQVAQERQEAAATATSAKEAAETALASVLADTEAAKEAAKQASADQAIALKKKLGLIQSTADDELAQAQSALSAVAADVLMTKAALASLRDEIDAKTAELALVNHRLDEADAARRAILAGGEAVSVG